MPMTDGPSKSSRRRKKDKSSSRRKSKQKPKVEDELYAIKDIIDEKYERGRVWYRIDWEDDPNTGEQFDPSWEPAENATEDAIAAWEKAKGERAAAEHTHEAHTPSLDTDSQPVLPPNERTKNFKRRRADSGLSSTGASPGGSPQKKRRLEQLTAGPGIEDTGLEEESTWSFAEPLPQKRGTLVVGVPARPHFDPAEYIPVGPSSSSQNTSPPHPLPNRDTAQREAEVSQRTIPDSQDFPESIPSHITATSGLVRDSESLRDSAIGPSDSQSLHSTHPGDRQDHTSENRVAVPIATTTTSQEASEKSSKPATSQGQSELSGEPIPSRQPDSPLHDTPSFQSTSTSGRAVLADSNLGGGSTVPPEFPADTPSHHLGRDHSPPPGNFLSQPDFGLEVPTLESSLPRPSDRTASEITSSGNASGKNLLLGTHVSRSVITDTSPHSAQVVRPLSSNPGDIRTQSDDQISIGDNEDQAAAATEHSVSTELPDPQSAGHPLSRLNGDIPTSSSNINNHEPAPPSVARSDHGPPSDQEVIAQIVDLEEGSAGQESQASPSPLSRIHSPSTPPARNSDKFSASRPRPSTPSPPDMDRSSRDASTPLSAVERFRKLQAEVFGQSPAQSSDSTSSRETGTGSSQFSLSPAAQPQQAGASNVVAPSSGQYTATGDLAASPALHPTSAIGDTPSNAQSPHVQYTLPHLRANLVDRHQNEAIVPATVAPLDLAPAAEPSTIQDIVVPEATSHALFEASTSEETADDVLPGIESQQSPTEMEDDSFLAAVVRPVTAGSNGYIVTLPMLASTRAQYLKAIHANKSSMLAYGDFFTTDNAKIPDGALISTMDSIFQHLSDLCDMPAFAESLPEMTPDGKKKHATGTNSKFSFVYELLEQLQDLDTRVLLVARPGRVLEFIEAVVATSGFSYHHLGQGTAASGDSEKLAVILASSDQDLTGIQPGVDVVILFDSSARSVDLPESLARDGMAHPIVLSLVVTCSIEHIDLRLSENMDPLSRRNAVNFALVASQELIRDPKRSGFMEPHEVALHFAEFIRDPDADLEWEPQGIPDDLFDFYLSSQVPPREPLGDSAGLGDDSARSKSRKRLIQDDVEEETPKRARIAGTQEPAANRTPPAMSDLLKKLLATRGPNSKVLEPTVEVSVSQLESLASKIALLSSRLRDKGVIETKLGEHVKSLETQVKSHEKSIRDIQPKYMEALRDRGVYEVEQIKALEMAAKMAQQLETSKAEDLRVKEQNILLETKLAEATTAVLRGSSDAEISSLASSSARELQEAKAKIETLEKKLATIQKDMDYSREAYQRASTSASELGLENSELKERIKELERMAADNLARIQQINAQNESQEYQRQWEESRAILRDRERELDRVREELRQLKSGRRETRHPSVPRSPRTGVMSPRVVGRGAGGGASSRGTSPAASGGMDGSPVAGMTFFNQAPGNGRWGHLRD